MNHVAAVMIFLLLMTAVKNSWGFHSNHHHVLNHILHQRSESMATTTAIKQRSYWLPATTRDDHYSQNNKETQTKSFTKRNGPKGNERQIISLRKQKDLGTILGNLRQGKEIDDWMKELVKQKQQQKETYFPKEWTSRDETDFIRILRDFRAYEAIELFVRHFARQNVYVYTAGMSALANAKKDPIRTRAILLLDAMDEAYVLPSSFTYAALFRSMDGPTEAKKLMTRLQTYKSKKVPWSVEAFNQAIMACSRRSRSSGKKASSSNSNYNATNHHQSWQVALEFFHSMRREGLVPNLQTFTHLLYVCGQTGQVRIALSLLQELQNTPGLEPNGKVWGALLSVFAQSGDYKQANKILKKMQDSGCNINLVHCSAFLKALSRVGEVYWSFRVLDMMTGALNTESAENAESETNDSSFEVVQLPTVTPDLVALNTVLSCCAKAVDFQAARNLLDRMKNADFLAPGTLQPILPDEISYSLLLSACRDPAVARDILKEIKLTRRHRVGVVQPSSITYARAIAVCRKAEVPDVGSAQFFLEAARKDGVGATVFMYSAAIWTAERSGDCGAALQMLHEMKSVGVDANIVCYNGVLSTLARQGHISEAIEVYEEMKDNRCRPTATTFKALAHVLKKSETENKTAILEHIYNATRDKERSVDISGPVTEALIRAYGQEGSYEKAKLVFDSIEGPTDGSCLRAVLFACAKAEPSSRWEEAISILHSSDITAGAIGPGGMEQGALSSAIIACAKADRWEESWNLLQIYGVPARKGMASSLSVVAFNALVAACGRKGRPDVAVHILNTMETQYGVIPDERSYRNAVIACNQAEHERRRHLTLASRYGEKENRKKSEPSTLQWWECSLALLRRMQEADLKPDIQTFSSCISACEAAGQWQRALGVLQTMINDESSEGTEETVLNLFCFNAAISACEKGGAWVEALEIYERMISYGGLLTPNFVTLSALVLALINASQKELAQSKFEEGLKMKIINPWKYTKDANGNRVRAMDLHQFNYAMAGTAVRSFLDSILERGLESSVLKGGDLIVIVGKGLRSYDDPVLLPTLKKIFEEEYGIQAQVDPLNEGRLIVDAENLRVFVAGRSWR